MAYKGTTRTPYKKIYFKGRYKDFSDFYDEAKRPIYEAIIEVFKGFKDSNKRVLSLYLTALIQGLEWDSEFKFNRNETIVLTRDILPFFEGIEDYEKCAEIKNLYEELTKSKKTVTI
jgi:hypothetical protein